MCVPVTIVTVDTNNCSPCSRLPSPLCAPLSALPSLPCPLCTPLSSSPPPSRLPSLLSHPHAPVYRHGHHVSKVPGTNRTQPSSPGGIVSRPPPPPSQPQQRARSFRNSLHLSPLPRTSAACSMRLARTIPSFHARLLWSVVGACLAFFTLTRM